LVLERINTGIPLWFNIDTKIGFPYNFRAFTDMPNLEITPVMNRKEDYIERALKWVDEGRNVALATVIATWGSSPLPVGSQLLVDDKGAFEGSVSGGCIEAAVITEALDVIQEGPGKRLFFGVSNEQAWEVGLACGGEIEIYVERVI
jgi:hypothetical protein